MNWFQSPSFTFIYTSRVASEIETKKLAASTTAKLGLKGRRRPNLMPPGTKNAASGQLEATLFIVDQLCSSQVVQWSLEVYFPDMTSEIVHMDNVGFLLHTCSETCALPCLMRTQVCSVAAIVLDIYTDVFTDQQYHELISNDDFQRLFVVVLLKTWRSNELQSFPYQLSPAPKHKQILTSAYFIAKQTFESEPLFLGWNETSRFFQRSDV